MLFCGAHDKILHTDYNGRKHVMVMGFALIFHFIFLTKLIQNNREGEMAVDEWASERREIHLHLFYLWCRFLKVFEKQMTTWTRPN